MTPLILLVGFLGAGKTTYLRQLLPALRAQGLDPHVIINDYQNARVDAELLRELARSIVPISGSCVCCGSRDELLDALRAFEASPGRVLVIETNGTTDAGELIEWLALDPALDRFTQPIQLSLIDGQRWQKRFWHNALELEQAATAGYLFVSREEEIDVRRRDAVNASLEKHGILAPRVAPANFALELANVARAVSHLPGRSAAAPPPECGCGDHDHDHDHGHNDHGKASTHAAHHFASMQIDLPAVVSRQALASFLDDLPPGVLRVKGLARLSDSPEEFHVFQRVESSPVQWLPIGGTSRLSHPVAVLIGSALDPATVRAGAERFLGPVAG